MIGYLINVAEAEDYFENERLETEAWDELTESSGSPIAMQKTKVLTQAFNRIFNSPDYDLPDPATATPADMLRLKPAQCEEAYYLAVHLDDEDRRKGIQAQGVIEAGVVKEKYSESMLTMMPIPPAVKDLLYPWLIMGQEFGAVDICRDENESVNTKVCDI